MSQDNTLRLFKYFAQFVPKAVLTDLLVQPEHSSEAGYAEVKAELMLPSERIINDITTYICSSNPDFVADKVRNAPGIILFVEYGNINTNPASEYGVQKSVAITIAHEFNRSNNDNLNEALLMNNCNNLLNHLLITLEYDQNYNNGCGVIGQMGFPAQVAPIDPESFFGRVGWTAFLTVKENMVYDPLDTPWPDPGGQSPRSVIEGRLDDIETAISLLSEGIVQAGEAAFNAQQAATSAGEVAQENSNRLNTLETLPVENFSESFNLSAAKANTIQNCTSAIDVTVTIPLNEGEVKFLKLPVAFEQAGNGVVSIVGVEGVTVPAANKTAGQGKMIVLYEKSLNIYGIAGGVE